MIHTGPFQKDVCNMRESTRSAKTFDVNRGYRKSHNPIPLTTPHHIHQLRQYI